MLDPDRRSILDDAEMAWLDDQLQGDVDHLFIGTSLPFLIAQGIHDLEAINEAIAEGAWGPRVARWGEKMRRALDLEHWAAFRGGFAASARMVVRGGPWRARCGARHDHVPVRRRAQLLRRPRSARTSSARQQRDPAGRLLADPQPAAAPCGTCPGLVEERGPGARAGSWRRRTRCPRAVRVETSRGPWFDNNLATLEVRGRGLVMRWEAGEVSNERFDAPDLRQVARVVVH